MPLLKKYLPGGYIQWNLLFPRHLSWSLIKCIKSLNKSYWPGGWSQYPISTACKTIHLPLHDHKLYFETSFFELTSLQKLKKLKQTWPRPPSYVLLYVYKLPMMHAFNLFWLISIFFSGWWPQFHQWQYSMLYVIYSILSTYFIVSWRLR